MNAATATNDHTARRHLLPLLGVLGLVGLVLGLAAIGACGWTRNPGGDGPADDTGQTRSTEPTVGGRPLFSDWPKSQNPDAALVLSGETFGFIQPCGCSRPQKGGLERRAEFINGLKAKGWPVAGVDLGDLYPAKGLVEDQTKLKYRLMMNALRELGYIAVGVGKSEFAAGIDNVLGEYALQKEQPPFLLAGNLLGLVGNQPQRREERFPTPPGATRPLVGSSEVVTVGTVPLGVVGVVGKAVADEARKLDGSITFEETRDVLARAVATLAADPKKPQLNVLLYQGTAEAAKKLAEDWPQFRVILCQSDDPEPPQFPEAVAGPKHPAGQKTLVIQVGHKGRYVGLLGVFRVGAGFDLKYQLVPLGEEYITPGSEEAARKSNPILTLFDNYAEQVRDRNFLGKVVKTPHPAQIQEPKLNLSYVGSEKCQGCHAAQYVKWKDTSHSHALDALENIAKRPGLRHYDAECVQCHVVGMHYNTGYENQKTTPHLAHVGCESCHGPGSGHAADPRSPRLLALQSPWKTEPGDRLPDIATIKKIAALPAVERGQVALKPNEQLVFNRVSSMCAKCHDHENDPNFDLFTYWPKVYHSYPRQ
jgi:hypothetical protein